MPAEAPKVTRPNEYVYTPPNLPPHLSALYDLKPIVGQPSDEEVKAIHAAIRAVNAEDLVPHLHNPDLTLRLSQHLFSVQMEIYRTTYPLNAFPRDNIYTPPSLPTHIPIALEPVVGFPSDEQMKAAQNAMRVVESRGGPLSDPDLNMQLSQHLINLQVARYIQDSALSQFTTRPEGPRYAPSGTHRPQEDSSLPRNADIAHREIPPVAHAKTIEDTPPETSETQPAVLEEARLQYSSRAASEATQLREAVDTIKELLGESKGALEIITRVLVAIQRNQVTAGAWESGNYIHVNPVNQQGITAVECGLPQLRYGYHKHDYHLHGHFGSTHIAGYLKFFGIGTDMIEGDRELRLKPGKETEAGKLILKHLGLVY